MKKALALLALGLFITGGIVGCEASAKVGDSDDASYSKKTTTVQQPNGDTEVKTTTVHHD
jgi:hypothetical protein